MSHFWSLDDGDDGPSDQASQIRQQSAPLSPQSQSSHRGNASGSSDNPIYALLDTAGSTSRQGGSRNGSKTDPARRKASVEPPVMQLQRAWVSERGCPELLAWRADAVDDVCSQIEEQMTIVESLASDASTAEEEHVRLGLVELDVERARWLLKSYLRCRLDKIEQHASFLLQDRPSKDRMSDLERGYCVKFAQIQDQHFKTSVLDFLPPNLQSLEDKAESTSSGRGDMVTKPDLLRPVFIRCLEDCGQVTFAGQEEAIPFLKGSIHFVRYNSVCRLIEREQVEVL